MDLDAALGLGDRELVAFVGAGGKKTAMQHLSDRGRARELQVGYTTTTHMPPPRDLPLTVATRDTLFDTLPRDQDTVAFAAERVSNPDRAESKVRGYDAEFVDAVYTRELFDWLLVKADGARRREFKAPGSDEPVVPAETTHLVPVVSVRAVGEPLDDTTVHRPERVTALTGTALGEPITPRTVATVLMSDQGGLKGTPDSATVTPLLNKADTPELRNTAEEILRIALAESDRLQRGLVTSFRVGYCAKVGQESTDTR